MTGRGLPIRMAGLPVFGAILFALGVARAGAPEKDALARSREAGVIAARALATGQIDQCLASAEASITFRERAAARLTLGRCQERAARYLEARRNAERATTLALENGDTKTRLAAVAVAARLVARIPHVRVVPAGGAAVLDVTIDGAAVPLETALREGIELDPGLHHVSARGTSADGALVFDDDVRLRDGETVVLRLAVVTGQPPVAPPRAVAVASAPPLAPPALAIVRVDAAPAASAPRATPPAPPRFHLSLGGGAVWRRARVCPGVSACNDAGPVPTPLGIDTRVDLATSTPAVAGVVRAEVFPVPSLFRAGDDASFTFGVTGELWRTAAFALAAPAGATRTGEDVSATYTSFSASATARFYFHALRGTGFAGVEAGYFGSAFSVAENRLAKDSSRGGFDAGVRGELPLVGDYLRLAGSFAYIPQANPGAVATSAYGTSGTGSGFLARAGLTGQAGPVSFGVYGDLASFTDRFGGAGAMTTNGSVGEETTRAVIATMGARF